MNLGRQQTLVVVNWHCYFTR